MRSDSALLHPLARRARRVGRPVAVALAALVLSSCLVLKQDQSFAIGTEAHRANLVVYVTQSTYLDHVRTLEGTTVARNTLLAATPTSISLPPAVMTVLCSANPALCVAGDYVPDLVLSWFRSDVRNRSDFANDLSSAARQQDCFAWTFVPSRNFTTKPTGNSGCRHV